MKGIGNKDIIGCSSSFGLGQSFFVAQSYGSGLRRARSLYFWQTGSWGRLRRKQQHKKQ